MKYDRGKGKTFKYNSNKRETSISGYQVEGKRNASVPQKEEPNAESTYLQKETFSSLRAALPITVKADPNIEGTRAADPYAIINQTNPMVNASYSGQSTLAGNTFPLLLNNTTSRLLNVFDMMNLPIAINYLYQNISGNSKNTAVNQEIGRSITEALSTTYGQMYTTLPFFTRTITSPSGAGLNSMPTVVTDPNNYNVYLTWYQTNLQNIALVPSRYNLLMAMENTIKSMSYNREANLINDLFGLMKKNSFRAMIQALADVVKNEYFDLYWRKQVNTMCMVPSRKSESIEDPLMTITPIHRVPSIKVEQNGTTIIDNNTLSVTVEGVTYTLYDCIKEILTRIDPVNVLAWARQYHNGSTSVTATQYFNEVALYVEYAKLAANHLEAAGEDIRVALSVAQRAGLNNWVQGVKFDVTTTAPYKPVYNKIVEDIFRSYFASSGPLVYDSTTYRWKFYSMWNKYSGISKFDTVSGGAFLTISTRGINSGSDSDFTSVKYLLPVLFEVSSNQVATMYSRVGTPVNISYHQYTSSEIDNDKVLNRLNPISFSDLVVRVPEISLTAFTNIPNIASPAYQVLANVFGLGRMETTSGNYDACCNSDNICYIDVELDDVSNQMIVFAQTRSPFKVYNSGKNIIGFNE